MSGKTGTTWLKWGCLGCVGLVGLVVVVVGLIAGVAFLKARSERIDDRVVTREVPAEPATPPAAGENPVLPAPGTATRPGRVVLDLSESEFQVGPGKPGEPIRVEASYDRNSYVLEEHFEPAGEGAGWTYTVSFHRTGSGLFVTLKQFFSGSKPRVRIFLPPDALLTLEAHLAQGGAQVELGGLQLASADLDVSMGGLELSVREPLKGPMDSCRIHVSMGGAEIRKLGNASPRKLDVEYSMGGMSLDLRGLWVTDSDVTIRGSMGGGQVKLPRDIRVEGVPGRTFEGRPQGEVPVPTLRFSAASSMGELEFD